MNLAIASEQPADMLPPLDECLGAVEVEITRPTGSGLSFFGCPDCAGYLLARIEEIITGREERHLRR